MPTYEMPLLLRAMKKPDLMATLKRTSETIFKTGGFIRKMENWGLKELPCKISIYGHVHRQANHFCIYFDAPRKLVDNILDECNRDIDIVRIRIFKQLPLIEKECTFHEEMLPAPYRPSVLKLLEIAKKKQGNKEEFKYNSGMDYYPFKR